MTLSVYLLGEIAARTAILDVVLPSYARIWVMAD